ncbi:RagB/SusD family nutrient uptake outer membrane protein [Solitalea longa]|uniref:RagB/SusD family nutrient uptake outer membrane protein n=1 Tax=Solitalea longa TaxID=2079460 RepID=A0A2S4ZXL8_9SPHI|nr:RagB/SusD family nutrient uptake outer membrane protein [Solitalea longa]POY35104.1 RagB/SusD family nutrient uptake outer membrane protein [Solitalea longa]
MKKIYILVTALTLSLTACSVNEEILDEANGGNVVSDSKNMEMIAAPAYAYLRDLQGGSSGVWGTVLATTDELAWPGRGADWQSPDRQALSTHTYTPTNSNIKNTWNSFLIGINKSNISLKYLSAFPQSEKKDGYMAEIRFIRALCMFKLMDNFGKFPFREYTEIDFSKSPVILKREQAVERIIKELNEIIPLLKNKSDIPYGRVSKAAAQMLLAHVYLNHEVYTGKTKWAETIKACDDIINSGQYKIADDYWKLFQFDNAAYLQSTESILSVIYDETNGLTGSEWVRITIHYNQKFGNFTAGGNNGCCTTPAFVNTWDESDQRFSDRRLIGQLGFNQGFLIGQQYSVAGVALTTRDNKPLIFTKDFSIANSTEAQGVRIVKFAPNPPTTNTGAAGNDFPLYRLSDTYLIRAEAKFRAGDEASALEDINYIRNTKRGQPAYTSLDLDKILNERGYELYWEGGRRTDLIRFNKYRAPRAEKNFETPAHMVLLPIPISAIEANPDLLPNNGY